MRQCGQISVECVTLSSEHSNSAANGSLTFQPRLLQKSHRKHLLQLL